MSDNNSQRNRYGKHDLANGSREQDEWTTYSRSIQFYDVDSLTGTWVTTRPIRTTLSSPLLTKEAKPSGSTHAAICPHDSHSHLQTELPSHEHKERRAAKQPKQKIKHCLITELLRILDKAGGSLFRQSTTSWNKTSALDPFAVRLGFDERHLPGTLYKVVETRCRERG